MFYDLIYAAVVPLFKELWWGVGEDRIDSLNTFTVDYHHTKDKNLDLHVDDAEITINYCLGEKFTGGDLVFEGVRCLAHQDLHSENNYVETKPFRYKNVPGRALIHLGKHLHRAEDIESGER